MQERKANATGVAAAVPLSLLAATAAPAQEAPDTPTPEASTLYVTPVAGNMFFVSDLVPTITVTTESLETAVSTGLENQFSPGLRAGVRLSDHFDVEAVFHYAASELSLDPEIGTPVGFDADVLFFGGGGRYRLLPSANVSPFLTAGAGGMWINVAILGPDGETDFMWNVGAGALFETGWIADVRFEVRDFMSEFRDEGQEEGKLQHDLWVGVGLEFGVL